jgi:hypothetical protein
MRYELNHQKRPAVEMTAIPTARIRADESFLGYEVASDIRDAVIGQLYRRLGETEIPILTARIGHAEALLHGSAALQRAIDEGVPTVVAGRFDAEFVLRELCERLRRAAKTKNILPRAWARRRSSRCSLTSGSPALRRI